mmetsp:Transcript_1417/g.3321  ORF Transcript_1417/g.3321 Transcript_1417/m.3321 type:complete len:218 (-) Transcript_1417:33-686(-)
MFFGVKITHEHDPEETRVRQHVFAEKTRETSPRVPGRDGLLQEVSKRPFFCRACVLRVNGRDRLGGQRKHGLHHGDGRASDEAHRQTVQRDGHRSWIFLPSDFRHHVVLRAEADHHPEALPRRKHGSVRRVFHETSPAREEVAKRHRVGIPRDLAELEDPGHVQDWRKPKPDRKRTPKRIRLTPVRRNISERWISIWIKRKSRGGADGDHTWTDTKI